MKTIEVELRGPLEEKDYSKLVAYLNENAQHKASERRLFFDLSQTVGINNRELDVRAKITNCKLQIVVKKGAPAAASRNEAEVEIKEKSLKETLHLLSLLGYPKGVYGERKIERYQVGDIEFAIQDVVSVKDDTLFARFYEAEILTESDKQDEAEQKLKKLLTHVDLHIYDKEGWNAFEAKMNSDANGWFIFGETDISKFSDF